MRPNDLYTSPPHIRRGGFYMQRATATTFPNHLLDVNLFVYVKSGRPAARLPANQSHGKCQHKQDAHAYHF